MVPLAGRGGSARLSTFECEIVNFWQAAAEAHAEREAKIAAEREVELLTSKVDQLGKDSAAAAASASAGCEPLPGFRG
jgi:hypothetical protein